jgi:putative PEP-CTERM system TPR-repeat lipoprotein
MADRRYALAASALEQAVKISGGSPSVRANFGVSLIGLGQTELGLAQLQQAFAKDPGQARAGIALTMLYLKRNQPKNALQVIDAVVRREPGNAAALNVQGVVYVAAGDLAGGRSAYEKALTLDPRFNAARLNLARLDLAEGKPAAARGRLADLLKSEPRNGEAMFEMALLEERAGNAGEAIRWLEKAMTIPQQATHAGVYLTDLLLRQRNVDRALTVSKQVVAGAPKNLSALFARGRAQLAAGESGSARLTLKDASAVAGFDPAANMELARMQLAAKDRDGALYSVDRALKGSADYLPAHLMMAEMEIASGDYAKAEQRAKLVADRFAARGAALRIMGDLAVARGQYAAAVTHYRAALAKDQNADAALRVFRAQMLAGDTAKGLVFLDQWSKENPDEPSVQRALADGYLRTGNLTSARAVYERLLARRPGDADVLNNLAQVALRQGDKAAALAYAENAYGLAKSDAAIIDTLGWVLVQQGQLDRGIGILREARLRDPSSSEIRYHLAVALAQTGREAEARTELAQILKDGGNFDGADAARKLQRQLGP